MKQAKFALRSKTGGGAFKLTADGLQAYALSSEKTARLAAFEQSGELLPGAGALRAEAPEEIHGEILARTILGDRLEISTSEVGGENDKNEVFYFDLPLAVETK